MQPTHLALVQTLAKACDCHTHVFDGVRYSFARPRAYTPGEASVAQLQAMLSSLGMQRVVLVQPSVYGTDNACMLAAMEQLGLVTARGVAVVDMAAVSDAQLQALHTAGVRGLRINLHMGTEGVPLMREQVHAALRLKALPKWHLQIHAKFEVHAAMLADYSSLASQGVSVVLDHFAGACLADAQLPTLLQAMRELPIYVKLSAAYRLPKPTEAAALAKLFYDAAPTQVLWGSDWPHTGGSGGQGRSLQEIEPFREIDNSQALNTVLQALGSKQAAEQLFVNNPAQLYDF